MTNKAIKAMYGLPKSTGCLLVYVFISLSTTSTSAEITGPGRFFASNYVGFEIARNTPFGFAKPELKGSGNALQLSFRNTLRDSWIMGINTGYREFHYNNAPLSVFIFSQDSQLLYRLSHPVYFSVGPKFMLLLPAIGHKIPPKRSEQFSREIGAGVTMGLYYCLSRDYLLSFRFDQWRGVNRKRFAAYESALAFHISI